MNVSDLKIFFLFEFCGFLEWAHLVWPYNLNLLPLLFDVSGDSYQKLPVQEVHFKTHCAPITPHKAVSKF